MSGGPRTGPVDFRTVLSEIMVEIGSSAAVTYNTSKNGYSVSNYPNPATSQTTINTVLPVSSDVTLTIFDDL